TATSSSSVYSPRLSSQLDSFPTRRSSDLRRQRPRHAPREEWPAGAEVRPRRWWWWRRAHPGEVALAGCCSRPPAASSGSTQRARSEEHTSELQSRFDIVCRLLLEKKIARL